MTSKMQSNYQYIDDYEDNKDFVLYCISFSYHLLKSVLQKLLNFKLCFNCSINAQKKRELFARKDLITQNKMHFQRIFYSYPDFGLHILQRKVTLKSPKSSERDAISLADKAKPEAEVQWLKKRVL